MSLNNKKADMTPFDMAQPPCRPNPLLMLVVWTASFVCTCRFKLRIDKSGIKGLKPPYIVLATHQGFSDYYIAPLALFPHRAGYVSDMEGFAAFGKALYRGIGCIGKRRFVPEPSVIVNIRRILRQKRPVVLYPESRHCNAGVTSLIPDNMGRLCKLLGVPVVILSAHGSYLANPFWDESHTRSARLAASLECICDAQQIKSVSAEELQRIIEEKLSYNEYEWQVQNDVRISYKDRCKGLHMALYRCRACEKEHTMRSEGSRIFCEECGSEWVMDELGRLNSDGGTESVADWYAWQQSLIEQELSGGGYHTEFNVRVEALPNEKGFVPLGEGTLTHGAEGFKLQLDGRTLSFSTRSMESVQTEYDYRGRGSCLVLSDRDCCYYCYCSAADFSLTKLQFAAEYLHRQTK